MFSESHPSLLSLTFPSLSQSAPADSTTGSSAQNSKPISTEVAPPWGVSSQPANLFPDNPNFPAGLDPPGGL